jgi:chaperone modulatory protein CbpM
MHSAGYIDFKEMAERCQLSLNELHELLEYGVLPVLHVSSRGLCFPVACLGPAQKAAQIKRDYALDLFAMGIVLDYLQKIDALELANAALRSSLQKPAAGGSAIICEDPQ